MAAESAAPQVNGTSSAAMPEGYNGRYAQVHQAAVDPIAIVGMAMRLPGGIEDADGYWDLLAKKKSGHCRVPKDRYNVEGFYGPKKRGQVGTRHGYFLQNVDVSSLDGSFFSMGKQEISETDPQQRLLLEVVYEALENAGEKQWRGKNIGCYVGVYGEDWHDIIQKDVQNNQLYKIAAGADFTLANRLSYEYDFQGPRYVFRCCLHRSSRTDSCQKYDCSYCLFVVSYWPPRGLRRPASRRLRVRHRRRHQLDHVAHHDHQHVRPGRSLS